jgi:hypothetical protein
MRISALLTRLSFTPQVLLTATSAKTEMVPETSTSLQKVCEVQNSSVRPPLVCNIKNELIQLAGEVGLLSVGRGGGSAIVTYLWTEVKPEFVKRFTVNEAAHNQSKEIWIWP